MAMHVTGSHPRFGSSSSVCSGARERWGISGDGRQRPLSYTERPMTEQGIKRAYARIILIWLAVLAGLWWLQHAFD